MKILILGNSSIFQRKVYFALRKFKKLEIEMASIRKINKKNSIKKYYHSYNEALEETEAKIVYISLINSEHYKWAIKCLNKKKHVIVDKPITISHFQTRNLIQLAKKKRLLLSEAIVFQNDLRFKEVLKKINLINSTKICCKFHIPKLEKNNFRNFKKYGGGCFQDMSPYASYLINIFFKNKDYSFDCIKKKDVNKTIKKFDLYVKSRNINLEASFSYGDSYKNEITIYNKSKTYFINYLFSPPIDTKLKLEIFDNTTKKKHIINYNKQNVFYAYFNQIFNVLRKNKYNFFYKEIQNIDNIKKKIS